MLLFENTLPAFFFFGEVWFCSKWLLWHLLCAKSENSLKNWNYIFNTAVKDFVWIYRGVFFQLKTIFNIVLYIFVWYNLAYMPNKLMQEGRTTLLWQLQKQACPQKNAYWLYVSDFFWSRAKKKPQCQRL